MSGRSLLLLFGCVNLTMHLLPIFKSVLVGVLGLVSDLALSVVRFSHLRYLSTDSGLDPVEVHCAQLYTCV